MSSELDDRQGYICACHGESTFYNKLESHLGRIFFIVLAVFAMYKVVVVEAPHRESATPPPAFAPCEPKASAPRRRKRQKKRHHLKTRQFRG